MRLLRRSTRVALAAAALTLAAAAPAAGAVPAGPAPTPTPSPSIPAVPTLSPADAAAAGSRTTLGGAALTPNAIVVDPAAPPLPTVPASAWLVADLGTGDVLAERDAHGRYAPASCIKMLTALTLLPVLPHDAQVTATAADAAIDGSKVGLVPGTAYAVQDLFTAMMVVSGNDAATALAGAYGGAARTVEAMQGEADRLQAKDTVAATPTGLDDPRQVSSAYDLALIARAGLDDPDFRALVGTRRAQFPKPGGSFEIDNHNALLGRYPGAFGVKNGYTEAAQASYVGAATRDGRTLLVVLLHAAPAYAAPAKALLDWGFSVHPQRVGRLVSPLSERVLVPAPAHATLLPARTSLALHHTPPSSDHALLEGSGVVALTGLVLWRRRMVRLRRRARHAMPRPSPELRGGSVPQRVPDGFRTGGHHRERPR